ncbi:MAG: serine/threonine-protein kinase, partial [Planctomycetota bacterium]
MSAQDDDSASLEAKRYALLSEIFSEAGRLSPEEREAFLDARCARDLALRREVEELLELSESGASEIFSEPKIEEAREALEGLLEEAEGASETDPAWVPEVVGPYRVVRRIAEGGMGVVYEAEQTSPRRKVALKVIHPLLVTPTRLRRFRQEAEVLGRLQHPGIAQIYEAGTYDLGRGEQPYIAMEFVEGETLTAYAKERQLPLRARLKLLALICDAVDHANEMGVIHRDLKPDNILIDGRGQPKVLDFGIARASEGSTMLTTMVTEQGDLLGTIAYMAPEQLEGQVEEITARSDVYGL